MGIRMRFGFCFFLFVILCGCISGAHTASSQSRSPKNVQVALRAKWSGTPILLEAGELISKEWKDIFWDFVDSWIYAESSGSKPSSAKDCLNKILAHGRALISEPLASLFEFSLTLRAASPRLVLYRQLAEESLSSFPLDDEIVSSTKNGHGVKPQARCCWVDTGSSLFLEVSELRTWLQNPDAVHGAAHRLEVFEFDHVHPDSALASPTAVLYGALGTKCFEEFHLALSEAVKLGKVKYVVRSVLPVGCESESSVCGAVGSGEPLHLGGYGVELALKNMEYKAMDDSSIKKGAILEDPLTEDLSQDVKGFIFSKILERRPGKNAEIMAFRDHLLSSTISDTLDVWELKDLGHQTAQRILHASNPLQTMQEISQNFPSIVSLISRTKLNESIKDEIISNQRMIPPGKSLMALNGALIDIEDVDIYLMLGLVHQGLSLAEQYTKLKIPSGVVKKLLSVLSPSESFAPRVDFRSVHVHYINNLEVDAMYKRWRSNLNELLMPVFPGQLRYIRKNLFHAVYILDPASPCGLETVDMIISLFENNYPMRLGVIFYSSKSVEKIEANNAEFPDSDRKNDHEDIADLEIRLFNFIKENYGVLMAFQFLSNVNKLRTESDSADRLEMHHVEGAFVDTILPKAKSPPQETLLRVEEDQRLAEVSMESTMFVIKLGFSKLGCSFLMNGLVYKANEEDLINAMNEELPRIQEQVYYGQINSQTDVLDKFLSESGVQRYNPKIIAEEKAQRKFISLCETILTPESVIDSIYYLHSLETMDDLKPVTHLLVADVDSQIGIKLLHEGIRYLIRGSKNSRVGVLFSSSKVPSLRSLVFIEAFKITASAYSHKKGVLQFLDQLISFHDQGLLENEALGSHETLIDKVIQLADANELPTKGFKSGLSGFSSESSRSYLNKVNRFLYRHRIQHGVNAVVTNGRVFPLLEGSTFLSHDLHLLESLEFKQRIKHISEIIETIKWEDIDPDALTSKFISDVIMAVSSSISARDRSSESARFEILSSDYSAVILGNEDSSIHIDAVIDPLSPSGQKLSSLLGIISKYVQPSMRLVLNPVSSLADLPLRNYYRYVVPTMEDFSTNEYTVSGPKAVFANMPLSKTLTMNLDVPEPWLVQPIIAIHDLDNILLENLGETRTLQAVFELEALLLTGHCSEKDHEPPRGLQLILGTKNNPHFVDTLVMANLGYWQMKTLPGVWNLQLAPGRSSNLYDMKVDGEGTRDTTFLKRITIEDLRGKLVHLEVVKKRGMERETLLVPSSDDNQPADKKGAPSSWNSNILKRVSGFIGGTHQSNKRESVPLEPGARHGKKINIFSVASGHLYERFLKIMILSVLKNTHRPVKFWFIKNYLSPPFKDVIPHMAEHYGFEYELITYKWPSWLHKQKEKQRIIWAYKILFLDVIFPLDLEKVIFVDADQIVRADMGELYDMNLNGRPLAYTPFCDNNKDMDGYRFWKQGFWKDHLRGKPYHISALYVVDLEKFRATAAGDQLRVFYETLSKDPNSLSNLDQDLPNYAQHMVPIFSLPQEWLWCESWCGNATKPKAKTIDLCNNPMTKEPKLQGAKRIVAEWPDLDLEARRFTAQILGETLEPQEQTQPQPQVQPQTTTSSEDTESKSEL